MPDVPALRATLANPEPAPTFDLALQALWWAAKPDWDRAHECAQGREGDPACDLVHAHLHRVEGDEVNAAYWYRRAHRPVSTAPLQDEWSAIAAELLARPVQPPA